MGDLGITLLDDRECHVAAVAIGITLTLAELFELETVPLEMRAEMEALLRRLRLEAAREAAPCDFCRNRPVGNAARWLGGSSAQPACPRCGERYDTEGKRL